MLRSPGARWVGAAVGAIAFVLLVAVLAQRVSSWRDVASLVPPTRLPVALVGFAVFHLSAIRALSAVRAPASARVWAASQVVKYIPAPGSSLMGMMAAAVRRGASVRDAARLLARHTAGLLGAALVVGSMPAVAAAHARFGTTAVVVGVASVAVGVSTLVAALRRLGARRGSVAAAWLIVAWLGASGGAASLYPGSVGDAVLAGGAFTFSWAVGFLALPVPAGMGVREAALVGLLSSVGGTTTAIAFAVATRLVHALSDGVLALLLLVGDRADQPDTAEGALDG